MPQNAKRVVNASAYRRGKLWTVILADVDQGIASAHRSLANSFSDYCQRVMCVKPSPGAQCTSIGCAARLQQVSQFVEQMRKDFDVPGVAIGIIQNGKVVMARGFGVRQLGKPAKVDADTRFMIASNTKALTTLMLAKLVDAGKLDWNARAEDVYPGFKLGDAATTDKVLVKHLICACTGVPRQDMEWLFEGEKQTRQRADNAGHDATHQRVGELFQYSNPMAAAAGYIGGQVAYPGSELGAGYVGAMQALVIHWACATPPSIMSRRKPGDYAAPHGYDINHKVQVMGMGLNDTIIASRPAGAAWSTVDDMLKYVQMEIDRGLLPDGKRYIGEAAFIATS